MVFDVGSQREARLLFYMARQLIRVNDPEDRDDLLFLLCIPSVRALAHTEVTEGMPNELLRSALLLGNAPP